MINFNPHATYPASIPTGTILHQPGATLQTDPTGLATSRHTFRGRYAELLAGGPFSIAGTTLSARRAYRAPDPFSPSLLMYTGNVTGGSGLFNGIWSVEYRGLDPALSQIPPPVYSLDRSTSSEPLSTHLLWSNKNSGGSQINFIAGTPSSPQNGAIFVDPGTGLISTTDATGIFKGWASDSPFYGIESYLAPGMTWTSSYVAYSPPSDDDLNGVGTIQPPDGQPPTPDGYQWIYLGIKFTDNAGLYRMDKSWRCFKENYASSYLYSPTQPPINPNAIPLP